jgi:hypothetical protein
MWKMIPTHQTFYYLSRDHVESKGASSRTKEAARKAALQRKEWHEIKRSYFQGKRRRLAPELKRRGNLSLFLHLWANEISDSHDFFRGTGGGRVGSGESLGSYEKIIKSGNRVASAGNEADVEDGGIDDRGQWKRLGGFDNEVRKEVGREFARYQCKFWWGDSSQDKRSLKAVGRQLALEFSNEPSAHCL